MSVLNYTSCFKLKKKILTSCHYYTNVAWVENFIHLTNLDLTVAYYFLMQEIKAEINKKCSETYETSI